MAHIARHGFARGFGRAGLANTLAALGVQSFRRRAVSRTSLMGRTAATTAIRQGRAVSSHQRKPRPPKLAGSVKMYDRHVLVVDAANGTGDWPRVLEKTEEHILSRYHEERKMLGQDVPQVLKCTAMALHEANAPARALFEGFDFNESHSVVVMPDNVAVDGLGEDDVPRLLEHLASGGEAAVTPVGTPRALKGVHALVCAHQNRDFRCAQCGGRAVTWLSELVTSHQVDHFHVWPVSHIGGHHLAGNVVVYPHGDWFGKVNTTEACERLVEHYAPHAQATAEHDLDATALPFAVGDLWRGRLGMPKAAQKEAGAAMASAQAPDAP